MIKLLREQFGLSQQELADYLRVSRSYLSMAELKHRDLPFTKMEPLYRFHNILNGPASHKKPNSKLNRSLKQQQDKKAKDLEWEIIKTKKQLADLRAQLNTVKKTQEYASNILQRIDELKDGTNKIELMLIEHMELNAYKMQAATGEDKVFNMELQVHLLKTKLNFLQKAV